VDTSELLKLSASLKTVKAFDPAWLTTVDAVIRQSRMIDLAFPKDYFAQLAGVLPGQVLDRYFQALRVAPPVVFPALQVLGQVGLPQVAMLSDALTPLVAQMAAQQKLIATLEFPLALATRVSQAERAWALVARPLPAAAGVVRPAAVLDVANVVAAVGSTAVALDVEDDASEDEPWRVARAGSADHLLGVFEGIDPKLAVKFRGMWHAVGQRGPDCVSQAANSAIELVDHTLRTLAPNKEVLAWQAGQAKYADEVGVNGLPHRSLRIRYIAFTRGLRAKSVDLLIKATTGTLDDLQKIKHAGDDHMVTALTCGLQAVEYCLLMLFGKTTDAV
jgi:hypothetical protein